MQHRGNILQLKTRPFNNWHANNKSVQSYTTIYIPVNVYSPEYCTQVKAPFLQSVQASGMLPPIPPFIDTSLVPL